MIKHTAGEWYLDTEDSPPAILSSTGRMICVLTDPLEGEYIHNYEENAQLIIHAPKMYEALCAIQDDIRKKMYEREPIEDWANNVRKLIQETISTKDRELIANGYQQQLNTSVYRKKIESALTDTYSVHIIEFAEDKGVWTVAITYDERTTLSISLGSAWDLDRVETYAKDFVESQRNADTCWVSDAT